jgi:hypothetical protein
MEENKSVTVSPELNYAQSMQITPDLRNLEVLPYGGGDIALSATAIVTTDIDLPSEVMYLSGSDMEFEFSKTAEAAFCHMSSVGCPQITGLQLRTQGGLIIADVPFTNRYMRAIAPHSVSLADLQSLEANDTRPALADVTSVSGGLSNSKALAATTPVVSVRYADTVNTEGKYVTSPENLTDLQYFTQSATGGTLAARFRIPFSVFKGSYFAVNKHNFFGKIVRLSIRWAPVNEYCIAAATAEIATDIGSAALTGATVSNFKVNLKLERNPDTIATIQTKMLSDGINTICPRIEAVHTDRSTNTSSILQNSINDSQGRYLLRVITATYPQTVTGASVLNLDNVTSAKVTSYLSKVGSTQLQDAALLTVNGSDYGYQQRHLGHAAAYQTVNCYRRNQIWVDTFNDGKSIEWAKNDQIEGGMSLGSDVTYNLSLTTVSAAYGFYQWYVYQRMLHVGADGIYFTW